MSDTSNKEAVAEEDTTRVRFLPSQQDHLAAQETTISSNSGNVSTSTTGSNESLNSHNDESAYYQSKYKHYGSTTLTAGQDDTSSTANTSTDPDASRHNSFHLGMRKVNIANVWTSMRRTQSFAEFGDDYEKVPSELADNVTLVTDPNLDPRQRGTLYYSEASFYNREEKPMYALTVHPDIYQRMLREVVDARATPCGLYFCCHGGDAAHTGVSHDDFVDIKVAWTLLAMIFAAMMITSSLTPYLVVVTIDGGL